MMKQVFLTGHQVETRWQEAFPYAQIHEGLTQLNLPVGSHSAVWLDARSFSREQILAAVKNYTSNSAKVVVLSSCPNDEEGLAVVQCGAVGYCHVLAHSTQLQEVALVLSHGGLWLGEQLLQKITMASMWAARQTPEAQVNGLAQQSLAKLTERESKVALEVSKGATNREVAQVLHVSERTVKAHLTSIFDKLTVRDRVQLALLINNIQFPEKTQAAS